MGEDGVRLKRLGLIGVGAWGRRYVQTIARRGDCQIVAYARASAGNGGDDGRDAVPGARRHSTWRELLTSARAGELDGLVVATTPAHQAEVAEAAVVAGVPILVEKPLGLSAGAALRIEDAFRRARLNAPVVVDYVHLWAPAYRELKSRVLAAPGGSGAVASIEAEGCNRGPFRGWSSLDDYGPHDVAMCLDLVGREAAFRLEQATRVAGGGSPAGEIFAARFGLDDVTVDLRVGNGAADKSRRFAVTLRDGRRIVYDDVRPHPGKLTVDGVAIPVGESAPLDAVITHFLACLEKAAHATAAMAPEASDETAACLAMTSRVAGILDAIRTRAGLT